MCFVVSPNKLATKKFNEDSEISIDEIHQMLKTLKAGIQRLKILAVLVMRKKTNKLVGLLWMKGTVGAVLFNVVL